jgi:hypothetical protein
MPRLAAGKTVITVSRDIGYENPAAFNYDVETSVWQPAPGIPRTPERQFGSYA